MTTFSVSVSLIVKVVGYFPIDGSHADAHITGELKLGFQVNGLCVM